MYREAGHMVMKLKQSNIDKLNPRMLLYTSISQIRPCDLVRIRTVRQLRQTSRRLGGGKHQFRRLSRKRSVLTPNAIVSSPTSGASAYVNDCTGTLPNTPQETFTMNPQITNLVIILVMMQVSKKVPFDDPNVLNGIRGLYILSNLIIVGIYVYVGMKIDSKKGKQTLHVKGTRTS